MFIEIKLVILRLKIDYEKDTDHSYIRTAVFGRVV